MKFVFTSAKRIDSCVIYTDDKQMFKRRSSDGVVRYACYREGCKARVIVNIAEMSCTYVEKFDQHSHGDNQEKFYEKCKKERNIKLKCRADQRSSLSEIFESEPGADELSFKKMKSAMVHNRQKSVPCDPTSADEAAVFFDNEAVKKLIPAGQNGLILHQFVSTEQHSFAIFVCPKILNVLPELRWFHISSSMRVHADGFFKAFLSISIIKDTECFPCIYVMLSQRHETAYKSAFQIIEEKWQLQITKAWIDYDLQLRKTVVDIYPSVIMSAYWYQLCYAIRRKCKLIPQFYESVYLSNASHLFHQVLCIPLLAENQILEAVAIMKRKCSIFPPLEQMLNIFDELVSREGVSNICVDWNWFGEKCNQNFNEVLKNKSTATSSTSSLFYLIQLVKAEQNKIIANYEKDGGTLKRDTLQVLTIKKFRHELNTEKIDVGVFLNRITFKDNTGCVNAMDHYHEGDEHDYIDDNGLYEQPERNHHQQVQQNVAEGNNVAQVNADAELCIVCYVNKRNVLIEPCCHLKFCLLCIETIHERDVTAKCPLCRVPIQNYRRVFV